jgi:anti-sigma regulatory factor (Ser/Thr protein kinase)
MILDIEQSYLENYSNEFEYRIPKDGVLKIDVSELLNSIPDSILESKNGSVSVNKSIIYYSPSNNFIGNDTFFFSSKLDGANIISKVNVDVVSTFKPKAHILVLLGEELIKSPVMAIYELIKNSYDADSKSVDVKFNNIEDIENSQIVIKDFGTGISKETLEDVWFEPGSDFRKPINSDGSRQLKRSPIYWRIPMGEKGVGRFAVHKLGHTIKLVSRPAKVLVNELGKAETVSLMDYEIEVFIDWRTFSQSKYLDDVKIDWIVKTNPSEFIFKESSGTEILIENLKETWTRGMARQLKRNTISMLSPKNDVNKFEINLDFGNWWLNDFPNIDEILNKAPYKLTALVDEEFNMIFEYHFNQSNNSVIGTRSINKDSPEEYSKIKYKRNIKGELKPFYKRYLIEKEYTTDKIDELIIDFDSNLNKILFGTIMLEIYSFDLDSVSLRDYTNNPSLVKNVLKDHAGIKVFKGDLRVYDYGDPGNDWLGLDIKRVNNKSWFSNNQNIGFIYLDDEKSGLLIEKTNREGFINNIAYDHFIILLDFLLSEFKSERSSDREKWLQFNKKGTVNSFESQLNSFKSLINNDSLDNDLKKQQLLIEAEKIEERYKNDKETLLIPAGVGMTASFAMHEIEKLVPRMEETLLEEPFLKPKIISQVDELKDYVEGILSVLKKGGNKSISVIESINQSVSNYSSRLKHRNIAVDICCDENIGDIFCDKRILITMLMNIIDNSIYWLDTIYKTDKRINFNVERINDNVSILIVDNGPGFRDSTEDIVSPFFSRKDGGIGIGMYLIDTVMIQYGKLNIIHDKDYLKEKNIPEIFDGAAVELIFNNK